MNLPTHKSDVFSLASSGMSPEDLFPAFSSLDYTLSFNNDDQKPLSAHVGVPFKSPPPSDFTAKIESADSHPLKDFEAKSSFDGELEALFSDVGMEANQNLSGTEGLMTAILGSQSEASDLAITSLTDEVFVAANAETAISVYPVISFLLSIVATLSSAAY